MYIALNINGIRQHLLLIEEERKKLDALKNDIYQKLQLAVLSSDNRMVDVYRQCWDDLGALESSFRWKSEFLENFADDFQKISLECDSKLDEVKALLQSVGGENLQRR